MKATNLIRMTSSDRVKGVDYVKEGTNLCRLPNGLICMGCCGLDFAKNLNDKEGFVRGMIESTKELEEYTDIEEFKSRVNPDELHSCGLCKQMVLKGEDENKSEEELVKQKHISFTCPLHPAENDGVEHRKGECDPEFMCETQKMFHNEWGDWTKNRFVEFVYGKNLEWFEYSKAMHNNALVKEFFESGFVVNYQN